MVWRCGTLLLLRTLTLNTGWSEIKEEWKVMGSLGAASSEELSAVLKDSDSLPVSPNHYRKSPPVHESLELLISVCCPSLFCICTMMPMPHVVKPQAITRSELMPATSFWPPQPWAKYTSFLNTVPSFDTPWQQQNLDKAKFKYAHGYIFFQWDEYWTYILMR